MRRGRRYGEQRLLEALTNRPSLPVEAIVAGALAEADALAGEPPTTAPFWSCGSDPWAFQRRLLASTSSPIPGSWRASPTR